MELGNWVAMAVAVIIGLIALNFAAHTVDPTVYDVGLLVFVVAVAVVFVLIKRNFDQVGRGQH